MFDALSPQRRRLVLGASAVVLLLIMTIAVIAVLRSARSSSARSRPAIRARPSTPGAGVRRQWPISPAAG